MSVSDHSSLPDISSVQEDIYTQGYSDAAIQFMMSRTGENSAGFFLPYLHSGMKVLDCGCGPGTITADLALAVAPGEIVGVDLEASQIDLAKAIAAERGILNASFEICNIYNLPFPDNTFDAVFGHTILMQLREPVSALNEIYRVLKPNGAVGFRETDFDGNLYEPSDAAWKRFWDLFALVLQRNGGNARIGKRLGALLQQAEFNQISMGASYSYIETLEDKKLLGELTAHLCEEAAFIDQAIDLGWANQDTRSRLSAALRTQGTHIGEFLAFAYCEAVGWKAKTIA